MMVMEMIMMIRKIIIHDDHDLNDHDLNDHDNHCDHLLISKPFDPQGESNQF